MKKFYTLLLICFTLFSQKSFSQLSGIKTIDPGGSGSNNYLTFAAAVSALNANGVAVGGVTFNVVSGGVFNETALTINITANKPAAGSPVVIKNAGTTPTINVTASTGTTDAAFKLIGTDYITFDGLRVNDAGTNSTNWTEIGFYLVRGSSTDGCQNVTIQNCIIDMNKTNNTTSGTSTQGIYEREVDIADVVLQPTSISGAFMNNKFNGNIITDVSLGIRLSASNVAGFYDENIEVGATVGNTITVGGLGNYPLTCAGILTNGVKNPKIANNIVTTGAGNRKNVYGIRVFSVGQGTVGVYSNTISVSADSSTIAHYGIYVLANGTQTDVLNVNNNIIENCQIGQPGYAGGVNFRGIQFTTTYGSVNVFGNIIRNNTGNTPNFNGPGLPCIGINNLQWNFVPLFASANTDTTFNVNIYNNQISGNTFKGHFAGIYSNASKSSIYSNSITTNSLFNSSSKLVCGIFIPGTQGGQKFIQNIYSNTIKGLSTDNLSTGIEVSGIRKYYDEGIFRIFDNTIEQLSSNDGDVNGIHYYLSFGTAAYCITNSTNAVSLEVFRNKINTLSTKGSGNTVNGMFIDWLPNAVFTATIHNNFVADLTAGNSTFPSAINGINIGRNINAKVYFNSINLNQTGSVPASFGSSGIIVSASVTAVDLRNNLVVNNSVPGSGAGAKTVGLQFGSTNLAVYNLKSNGNSFYGGASSLKNLVFYDGTNSYQTITAFKTAVGPNRDSISISANPVFTSSVNLHTNDVSVDNKGVNIPNYTTDIDLQNRSCPPEIGADEFTLVTPVNISGGGSYCVGSSSTILTASVTGGLSYTWTPSGTVSNTLAVTPTITTTYSVTASISGGCTSSSAITVTVNPSPTVTAVTSATSLCAGTQATLTANGATTYTWSTGATSSSAVVTPTTSSTYTVTGANGVCTGTAVVSLTVNPSPTVTAVSSSSVLCSGSSATLTGNGATTYTWNTGSNSATIVVSPTTTTTYTLSGTSGGCNNSVVITQSVSTCTGMENVANSKNAVVVYPNPNNGIFFIETDNSLKNTVIEMYDAVGRKVLTRTSNEERTQIDMSEMAKGIYVIKISSGTGELKPVRVIKQ